MAIVFDDNGPLKNATLYKINEAQFFDKTRPPQITAQPDDEPYVVKMGDRLDLIAFVKLESVSRGWIILERNNLRLWPNDLVPGITIMIPTIASLTSRKII